MAGDHEAGIRRWKRIILSADGTWNEAEQKSEDSGRPQPPNVLKVARAVLPRSKGTGIRTARKTDHNETA